MTFRGIRVAHAGGQVIVQRVRPEGGPKTTAGEFAKKAGLNAGAMLGA